MKMLLKWSLLSFFLFTQVEATSLQDYKKAQMLADLGVIKHTFEVGYAPLEWKKEYKEWDLEQEYELSKQRILTTPAINTKKFQKIVRDFVNSCSDYHVNVYFCSTEEATLPFSLKPIKGRYFIDWIDALKLPPSHYPLRVGDEIIAFNEVVLSESVAELIQASGASLDNLTDEVLATIKLTHRQGRLGEEVPFGPLIVKGISAKNHKEYSCQLIWSYRAEKIKDPFDLIEDLQNFAYFKSSTKVKDGSKMKVVMSVPVQENKFLNNGALGAYKSFVPLLGKKIWTNELLQEIKEGEGSFKESSSFSASHSFWHAYIYQHPQSFQTIGYLRIPHFHGSKRQVKEFEELIKYMEEQTDALVIDQVNNPGGIVEFVYQLAAYLTTEPLKTPLHRIKITQDQVLEAYEKLEFIRSLEFAFDQNENQTNLLEESKLEEFPSRYTYSYLMFMKQYYYFILNEWKEGHLLTAPTPICGIDRINPHFKYTYTKPILMLINELDFSGADFLPAILQDNKRVTLFGAKTAGAGGYVLEFQFPNNQGIDYLSYTASLAERTDLKKIENLGVEPDIEYVLTVEDVQNNYKGYAKAVNEAVYQLLHLTQ